MVSVFSQVCYTAPYLLTILQFVAHKAAFVQKIFVLNFITSYTPIFLTAFVYVPFGRVLVPYLDIWRATAQRFTKEGKVETVDFKINPDRLTKQIIYFTVTAQIVNFLLEVVVPYAKRKAFRAVKEVQTEILSKNEDALPKDPEEEAAFLARVRNEAELDEYDVTVDYREMVVQFGTWLFKALKSSFFNDLTWHE
jgi:hypothetical protein